MELEKELKIAGKISIIFMLLFFILLFLILILQIL